jgi:hypothetical protein
MKEPKKIPLDPSTPRSKEVKKYPLQKKDTPLADDTYVRPDNDSIYTPTILDKINKLLDESYDEDNSKNNS